MIHHWPDICLLLLDIIYRFDVMNFLSKCFIFILTVFIQFIGDSYILEDHVSVQGDVYSPDNGSSVHSGLNSKNSRNHIEKNVASFPNISYLELSLALRLLVVGFGDRRVLLCSKNKKGLRQMADGIKTERWLGLSDVVCVAVGSEQEILAIVSKKGTVNLFDIADGASIF